jgi:hypothetical protein
MENDDRLPDDLVWQDGHLTEVALTALADGEEAILPEQAAAHAAGCGACGAALGHAALLSLRVGEALREAPAAVEAEVQAPAPAPAEVQAQTGAVVAPARPLPVAGVIAALVIAAVAAAPGLILNRGQLPELMQALGVAAAMALRAGRAAVSGAAEGPGWFAALPWMSASVLVVIGLAVARAARGRLPVEGESR